VVCSTDGSSSTTSVGGDGEDASSAGFVATVVDGGRYGGEENVSDGG